MFFRSREVAFGSVPALATIVLLLGPAVAVAHAECAARLAREQKARQKAVNESPVKPVDKPKTAPSAGAAFVAAEAAKPPSGGFTQFLPTLCAGETRDLLRLRPTGEWVVEFAVRLSHLHRPVYQAQAPPPIG